MGCCSKKPVSATDVYTGEKKTGVAPATTRKCRDVVCLLLFIVFWIGMLAVAGVGLHFGEPKRLLYGTDYQGTTCGTGNMKDQPLTFYPRMSEDIVEQSMDSSITSPTDFEFYGVCVSECPKQFTHFCNYEFETELLKTAGNSDTATLAAREQLRKQEAEKLLGDRSCWFVAMASEKVFYRCIQMTETTSTKIETCVYPADDPKYYTTNAKGDRVPNELCEVKQVRVISDTKGPAQDNPIYDKMQTAAAMVGRAIGDIQNSWEIVLLFGGVCALVLGLVFIFLMKYFAGCMIWVTLWSFVLMLLLFALMVSTKAGIINDAAIDKLSSTLADAGVNAAQSGFQLPQNLQASEDRKQVYVYVAYISYALTGVAFLLVCFFQKRIRIAVGIIKEASRAIQRLPLLVLFPIWPFIMVMVLFIYSAVIAAYIYSSGDVQLDSLGGSAGTKLSTLSPSDTMRVLFAYHFFGFLWTNQLINAISMCTIAGAICRYYWSRDKTATELGRFPIMYSFKNCFRYHFGSLAFGSLIIAIVQFIRAILLYIDHQTQDLQKSNLVVKVVLKVVQCCMWCLEKCLKFLSKNAYIMIAMKGNGFCSSAKDAFKTMFTNAAQIATVSLVTFLLLGAAKIAIAMACAIIMFGFLEKNEAKYGMGGEKEISSPMAPILLTMLLAWFVASTFMGVYEMAIDTILLCFCEDREINKPTGQYFMSEQLRKFVASVPVSMAAGDQGEDNGFAPASPTGGKAVAPEI